MVRAARLKRGWTQAQLAAAIDSQQSSVHRIEDGRQNLSLNMVNKLAAALDAPLIVTATEGKLNYRIKGGTPLQGSITVRSSKNAAVALLCASMLNHGRTVLRGIAHIEEVDRICEVLRSIGMGLRWLSDGQDLELIRPERLNWEDIDRPAAERTRSILMFLGPLMHEHDEFQLPYAGGCDLGQRTVNPHLTALRHFGLSVEARDSSYHCTREPLDGDQIALTLVERGDTVTENALMAAARTPGRTVLRNASGNYMVQDLCFFLQKLGVQIEGIGTTTLIVHGVAHIDADVDYIISEDPIEAMSLLTLGIITKSPITVKRCPIEFLEVELAVLNEMGQELTMSRDYRSGNGKTRLVDITVVPSSLVAPIDKVHPMPFPGLNIDNLPFFAVICSMAKGKSTIYDWVYDNRAIHLKKLEELGVNLELMDAHRLLIIGPNRLRGRDMDCPPALRPAVCLMLAAIAAKGETVLRDVYVINRGYEDLPHRLGALGADIKPFW